MRAEFPQVELSVNGANLGFAEGNNAGIRHALEGGAACGALILNNDVEVDPGFLRCAPRGGGAPPRRGCARPADPLRPAVGGDLVRGRGLRPARRLQRPPARLRRAGDGAPLRRGLWRPTGPAARRCSCRGPCSRRSGVLRHRALRSTSEDTDWSLRARAAGYRHVRRSGRAGSGTRSRRLGRRELADDALLRHAQRARGRRAARAARPRRHVAPPRRRCSPRMLAQALGSGRAPRGARRGARRAGGTSAPGASAAARE